MRDTANAATPYEQGGQTIAGRQAANPGIEGRDYGRPGFAGSIRNGPRLLTGPRAVIGKPTIGPIEDLLK